jgi:hypothetical protein
MGEGVCRQNFLVEPMATQKLILLSLLSAVLAAFPAWPIGQAAYLPIRRGDKVTTYPPSPPGQVAITVEQTELVELTTPCQDVFISHPLDHTTTVAGQGVHLFDSNGAGLAVNDLDNDGDLDIVLANLASPNTIFWNEGRFSFRKEMLPHGDSRAANIVDIDGDGWQDIIFARRLRDRPTLWRNSGPAGSPHFTELEPFRLKNPYTMSWADLDGDGDLDLVMASYDAELAKAANQPNAPGRGGIIYYENQGDRFSPTYLAYTAQTLALLLVDINEDDRLDILAGNDFYQPDQLWLRQAEGWQEAHLFPATTRNTMSFDAGDIDNDGHVEIFATDMKPYGDDPETVAAWAPLMQEMHEAEPLAGDPQVMANVLLGRAQAGHFENRASAAGLEATGWSWSAKFGDLDNDGWLDVYVVNGMIAEEMFSHLPNNELVEENQAFRNDRQGRFTPVPAWGLNTTASGRSMSMADLDDDGDLDIVVNNLLAPAQIFENQLCGGFGLEVDLFWPASQNTRAIGAYLTLQTSTGSYHRDVRAASGYLSGDPARVHFGLPSHSQLIRLDIRWPDGQRSSLEGLTSQTLYIVTRQ